MSEQLRPSTPDAPGPEARTPGGRSSGPGALVPDFDADRDRTLAVIMSKGTLDLAYPGLVLATAALGEGIATDLFFTFWGMEIVNRRTMGDLKFTVVGNPTTHLAQGLGGLPGMTALATSRLKKTLADVGLPEVPELLAEIVASGGRLWACRMSIDLYHLTSDDLYDGLTGVISTSEFLERTSGAQLAFV